MNPISENDIRGYPQNRPKISEWFHTIKPTTQRLYTRYLIKFEHTSNTSLETLLHQAETNSIKPKDIRTLIINTTQDLTNSQQVVTDSAIRSFLHYNGVQLPPTTIKYQETVFYRGYTKQEIDDLIGYLDKPLEKLYATIAAESGLRADTILKIKWRHIQHDFNNRTDAIGIRFDPPFYKGKKKAGYTFIGTRSRELLKFCIEHQLIQTQPEAHLFSFSDNSIRKIIQRAKHKLNIDPLIEPIHGFRKYTEAQLEATKPPINERYRIMIMGRFKDTDAKAYSPRDFDTLRPEYQTAYPYLDYKNNAPAQTQEISAKQTQLQDTIKQLSDKLQDMQQQIDNTPNFLTKLSDSEFMEFILTIAASRLRKIANDATNTTSPFHNLTDNQLVHTVQAFNNQRTRTVSAPDATQHHHYTP
jgi:integrase